MMIKFISLIKNTFLPTRDNQYRPFLISNEAIVFYVMIFLVSKTFFGLGVILTQKSSLFAEVNAQKIILLTNDIRRQYNLPTLQENSLLDKAAQAKARDMVQKKYFAHYSPLGTSPWYWIDKSGYDYHYAGENLAMNFLNSREVIKAWLNSPKHRENLLNKHYKDIGVAVIPGVIDSSGKTTDLVVQMFGSPMRSMIATAQASGYRKKTANSPITKYHQNVISHKKVVSVVTTTITTTVIPSTTITSKVVTLNTSSAPVLGSQHKESPSSTLPPQQSEPGEVTKNISQPVDILGSLSRRQIAKTEKFISLLLVFIGVVVMGGVVNERRKYTFTISELLMRSIIIILVGLSFSVFNILSLVGQLKIY